MPLLCETERPNMPPTLRRDLYISSAPLFVPAASEAPHLYTATAVWLHPFPSPPSSLPLSSQPFLPHLLLSNSISEDPTLSHLSSPTSLPLHPAMQPSTARTPSPPPMIRRRPQVHRAPTLPLPNRTTPPSSFPEPIPFRARPHISPGAEISRPVPLRSRNTSFCTTGICPGCSGGAVGACSRSARSWSLSEKRQPSNTLGSLHAAASAAASHHPHRVVSFGSAVTPQSAGSTDGEEAPRSSWEWPWEEEEVQIGARRSARTARGRGSRSDSSSSSADWGGSALLDRKEAWSSVRSGARYRSSVVAPRSQSALAGEGGAGPGCHATPRADGPRPWDMTDGWQRQTSKNFSSFGFRKNHEGLQSFADTFSSRHLLRNGGKGAGRTSTSDWLKTEDTRPERTGRKRFHFLRRKLSMSGLKWGSGG